MSLDEAFLYLEFLQKELIKPSLKDVTIFFRSLSPMSLVIIFSVLTVAFLLPFIIYIVRMFRPGAGKGIESKMKAVKEFVAPGNLF